MNSITYCQLSIVSTKFFLTKILLGKDGIKFLTREFLEIKILINTNKAQEFHYSLNHSQIYKRNVDNGMIYNESKLVYLYQNESKFWVSPFQCVRPMSVSSSLGFQYFITCIDDYFRCIWLFLMKSHLKLYSIFELFCVKLRHNLTLLFVCSVIILVNIF